MCHHGVGNSVVRWTDKRESSIRRGRQCKMCADRFVTIEIDFLTYCDMRDGVGVWRDRCADLRDQLSQIRSAVSNVANTG